MLIYRTRTGIASSEHAGEPSHHLSGARWDTLFIGKSSREKLLEQLAAVEPGSAGAIEDASLLPPIESQEVWAAGVTYLRSRTARMKESSEAGGSSFYDMVYDAERPELFLKATPHRVVGSGQEMTLRSDSNWMVPEPEVTLAFDAAGGLIGYTIGNDLSSRDIEGQNPLYLPQAKVFNRCCALGPGLLLADSFPSPETRITLSIERNGTIEFAGATDVSQMKQTFQNLRDYLFRNNSFPSGCYLMTGTGIVPPEEFSLQAGDRIEIGIEAVGTLVNTVQAEMLPSEESSVDDPSAENA